MNFQTRNRNIAPLRSQLSLWHELSEIEQQSLSGSFHTESYIDRSIILGSIGSSKDGSVANTAIHEVGHAHGRPHSSVTKAIEIIFDAIE
ncbi:hypothetical protein [Allocoleopsis sp.]|uniref:hypothetical protein n=1 Tax=Allocoleopsis sp. TaxID=3088169 RepID=UPI002FD0560F